VFLAEPNGNRVAILNAHEGSWRMTLPLFVLSLLSISVGFLTKEMFIGFGTDFWNGAIFILPQNYVLSDIEFISLFNKQLPLIFTISGTCFAYFLYSVNLNSYFNIKKTVAYKIIYNFLSRKWYFDRFYNQIIGQNVLYYSYFFSYQNIDRGIIEILGPSSITNNIRSSYTSIKDYQSGSIFHYLFIIFLSILGLIFLFTIFSEFFKNYFLIVFSFILLFIYLIKI